MNLKLREYIEINILPEYRKNDLGHNIDHINYVIDRSFKFANTVENINLDMVYTVACYHDIGHHIDAKNHEKVSSEILGKDEELRKFFSLEEIEIMKDAVYDHRASLEYEPRNIYGKIVSTADRNTSIDIPLKRTYAYTKIHEPNLTLDGLIERARLHLIDKFGNNGYAKEKCYFKDEEYEKFLKDIVELTNNKEEFRERYIKVNNL